jgi:lauroyl/myristoyl acyltransferase
VVPPGALWFTFVPIAALRAARDARAATTPLPVRSLPAESGARPPSALERFRWHLAFNLRRPLLTWTDRLREQRWQGRFDVRGIERLEAALRDGPVVVVTLHTGALVVLGSWLVSRGITTASVVIDPEWLSEPALVRRTALASLEGQQTLFLPTDARRMVAFLRSGRALMMAADHAQGHVARVPWRNATVRLATGPFRVARLSGATVVPIVAVDAGRWRYGVTIGRPVPGLLIAERRHDEAAAHCAAELMPVAAARATEALQTLVEAVTPQASTPTASGSSRTGSGRLDDRVAH